MNKRLKHFKLLYIGYLLISSSLSLCSANLIMKYLTGSAKLRDN